MIIYLDEDNAYRSWVGHHRDGFVIEWLRQPTKKPPILHRATCSTIRVAKSKKTHWTSGRHLKACSLDFAELEAWAERESGHPPEFCQDCRPHQEVPEADHGQITKLGTEILDYVVEAAVIHMDNRDLGYELTVGRVADYLNKTTPQLAAALLRLVQHGYLRLDPDINAESELQPKQRVFPTSVALRMLPAFEQLSTEEIERELAALSGEIGP